MKLRVFLVIAMALCAQAADVKEKEDKAEPAHDKEKRQTHEVVPGQLVYRVPRKQEQVAPVEENQDDEKIGADNEEYRPGQVFSLNAQELLELQPERKSPIGSDQLLQQLYVPAQQEHKQNLQQVYYLDHQVGRQVSLHPSHAVIARPSYSSNGGEASVGAALSVSDTAASHEVQSFDQDLLALLQVRPEENRQYSHPQPIQQTSSPNLATHHQQIDRYITKPIKKTTKLRNKVINPTPAAAAPQQYLIETTNVQQQQLQQQHVFQQQQPTVQTYRPTLQPQRPLQSLRFVPIQPTQAALQQMLYDVRREPEAQGLKIVPAPKLQPLQQQQPRPQIAYRIIPQYQPQPQPQPQPEASPKQYRLLEAVRPQPIRQEQRLSPIERPVTYLKRYPEPEKMRAVKIYEQVDLPAAPQPAQIIGEQYYLRPVYRQSEQRARYELPVPLRPVEQPRPIEATKAPSSTIYVSKNLSSPKKLRPQIRPEPSVKIEQPVEQQPLDVNLEQHSQQSIEEQRARLPPPRNNKAYTPEEFAALVAAGYSVTPVPVSSINPHVAQSRASLEASPAQLKRRPIYRRPQYLPIRDDAP